MDATGQFEDVRLGVVGDGDLHLDALDAEMGTVGADRAGDVERQREPPCEHGWEGLGAAGAAEEVDDDMGIVAMIAD